MYVLTILYMTSLSFLPPVYENSGFSRAVHFNVNDIDLSKDDDYNWGPLPPDKGRRKYLL